jgi:hypothetical protein
MTTKRKSTWGGSRPNSGRKPDPLRLGKEVYLRIKRGAQVTMGIVYVVEEYSPKRIRLREKKPNVDGVQEEIIIAA